MEQMEVQFSEFKWVDIAGPTADVLLQLAEKEGLSKRIVSNCLDTDYLPQLETYGTYQFIILRLMEPNSKPHANSVQDLTTKIAIFILQDKLITIHRLPLKEIEAVKLKATEINSVQKSITKQRVISLFYDQLANGFDKPLTELEQKLDSFEEKLFTKDKSKNFIQEGFYLKRKAAAFKKVLKLTLDLLNKLNIKMECTPEQFQESKDRLERSLFYAEDVYDNIQSLMSLHLSIESQKTNEASFKTNEIMRVLTVLTIFFLPLNFLVGVFGMNFAHIPFLQHEYGFWFSIILMSVISGLLAVYLFKQGWLSKPDILLDSEESN